MPKHALTWSLGAVMFLSLAALLSAQPEAANDVELRGFPQAEPRVWEISAGLCRDASKQQASAEGPRTLEARGLGDVLEMAPCADGDTFCQFKCEQAESRCYASCLGCVHSFSCYCTSPPCTAQSSCFCYICPP